MMHGAAKIDLKAVFSMRRIAYLTFLIFAATAAQAQSHGSKRPPELEKWNVWAGDWSLSGKAKDSPTGPEYKVDWHLHEHWILNGFFMQVDQTWKGSGPELRALEILSFDPVRKVHTVSGFSSDGSTWALTASFKGTGLVERGESRGPGGELIRCQTTWTFSEDRMALSGMQECERNGVRWTAIDVRGRKSRVTKSGCLTFHLQALHRAGLILPRREGRQVFYSTDFQAMNSLVGYLTENCCSGAARRTAARPAPRDAPQSRRRRQPSVARSREAAS